MNKESYQTLAGEGEATYRELASKFIAHAFPIADEHSFRTKLSELQRAHGSARHFCFAWVLGQSGDRYRSNDDGEPSGTAGRPILRQLQDPGITYAAVIVIRYFGGTLLGKAGLIRAYGEAAEQAIARAGVVTDTIMERCTIECGYELIDRIQADVLQAGGRILGQDFAAGCRATIELPVGLAPAIRARWKLAGVRSVAN